MNRARGFTLLEVIVALVLMGSVLAGSLLAYSSHRKQLSMATKRIEATRIADQMVQQLSAQTDGIPVGTRGLVSGKPNWFWQTEAVGFTELATVRLRVVRFQIFERRPAVTPLVTIEIVAPTRTP